MNDPLAHFMKLGAALALEDFGIRTAGLGSWLKRPMDDYKFLRRTKDLIDRLSKGPVENLGATLDALNQAHPGGLPAIKRLVLDIYPTGKDLRHPLLDSIKANKGQAALGAAGLAGLGLGGTALVRD